jgi:IS5 family transposase
MLMTDDFFRNRLDQLIDLRHPLAVLANRMPWQEIEASLAHRFARQVRSGNLSSTLAKCKVLISLGSSQ